MGRSIGKSGYRGVTKAGKVWAATISVRNGNAYPRIAQPDRIYVGTYPTAFKAYKARKQFFKSLM